MLDAHVIGFIVQRLIDIDGMKRTLNAYYMDTWLKSDRGNERTVLPGYIPYLSLYFAFENSMTFGQAYT